MKYRNRYTLSEGRKRLAQVIGIANDIISIDNTVQALTISRADAAKRLARWAKQGWLRRVGPGKYIQVPLDSLSHELVLDDPWILIPTLYDPAYIGGRTAAEHWDLTEQIFSDIVIMTTRPIRTKTQNYHGTRFLVKHVQPDKLFGLQPLWRQRTKVMISDVHRTVVDMLDDPLMGGGIQHVADCLYHYLRRHDCNEQKLIEYADQLKNGAVFKRLGFLLETYRPTSPSISECQRRLTRGYAKLDPSYSCQKLISRWHLWIPHTWTHGVQHD